MEQVLHAIQQPFNVVNQVFENIVSSEPIQGSYTEAKHVTTSDTVLPKQLLAAFESTLGHPDAQKMIPSLNTADLNRLAPNTLVRFSCMIQDMHSPEYYLGVYEHTPVNGQKRLASGFGRDAVPPGEHEVSEDMPPFERLPMYCVPIPGETDWVRAGRRQESPADTLGTATGSASIDPTSPSRKRVLATAGGFQVSAGSLDAASRGDANAHMSPARLTGNTDAVPMSPNGGSGITAEDEGQGKKAKIDASAASANDSASNPRALRNNPFNHPLPGETGTTAIVKLYDPAATEDLKMGDCIEVIGILTRDPALNAFAPGFDGAAENNPQADVPRIHAIHYNKLESRHPVIARASAAEREAMFTSLRPSLAQIRTSVVNQLATSLGGDVLAAEYVLLNLVSRIYTRATDIILGNLSVNISRVSSVTPVSGAPASETLPQALAGLVPAFHAFPLSIECLSSYLFGPTKDYSTDTLRAGRLQLANGTSVVIDESALSEGKLDGVAVLQLGTLRRVLSQQILEFDFQYHKLEFPVDLPMIVLSEGKSTILPCSVLVPLVPDTTWRPPADANPGQLSDDAMQQCRLYLALVRELSHQVSEEVAKVAEESFVQARKQDQTVSPETFHKWLVLARLLSLSHGESELTAERWQQVLGMEQARESRTKA